MPIPKVAVIGANGKVATFLIKKLAQLKGEFDTVGFIRNKEQAPKFEELGMKYSTDIDLTNSPVQVITQALKPFDAVVFSAGAGGKGLDLTLSVDLDGACKVLEAIQANGSMQRLILVSALKSQERQFWWDSGLRSYYIAKKYADDIVSASNIQWTILQPGYLKDTAEETGKISDPCIVNNYAEQFKDNKRELYISREDVAQVIIESLRNKKTIGKFLPLIRGEVPISVALESV